MRDERGLVNLENTHSLDKEDDAGQWSSAYHHAHTGLAEAGHGREQAEDGGGSWRRQHRKGSVLTFAFWTLFIELFTDVVREDIHRIRA